MFFQGHHNDIPSCLVRNRVVLLKKVLKEKKKKKKPLIYDQITYVGSRLKGNKNKIYLYYERGCNYTICIRNKVSEIEF